MNSVANSSIIPQFQTERSKLSANFIQTRNSEVRSFRFLMPRRSAEQVIGAQGNELTECLDMTSFQSLTAADGEVEVMDRSTQESGIMKYIHEHR